MRGEFHKGLVEKSFPDLMPWLHGPRVPKMRKRLAKVEELRKWVTGWKPLNFGKKFEAKVVKAFAQSRGIRRAPCPLTSTFL